MTVSFPLTDLMDKIQDIRWSLFERQELSRSAAGITYGRSLGSALWRGEWTAKPMLHDDAVSFEAYLHTLDGVMRTFYGGDVRKRFPRMYPTGAFDESGAAIASLGTNGRSLSIDGLPAGFVISRGDYLAFNYGSSPTNRALHQASETVTCDGSGVSPEFEVRPHIRAGAAINDVVTFKNPRGIFVLEPESIDMRVVGMLHTQVSWKGIQLIQ